jgi:L-galactose dehydrogenase
VLAGEPLADEIELIERRIAERHCAAPRAMGNLDFETQNIAQLALQYAVAQAGVASTLASASSIAEIEKNVIALDSPLDDALVARVQAILAPIRDVSWQTGRPENN